MRPPDGAGFRARLRGLTVGREVTGNHMTRRTRLVLERDGEPVIGEWIRLRVAFTRQRSGQRERDFVPLLELALDFDAAVAVDGTWLGEQRDGEGGCEDNEANEAHED